MHRLEGSNGYFGAMFLFVGTDSTGNTNTFYGLKCYSFWDITVQTADVVLAAILKKMTS